MQETRVWPLGQEDPLEKEMATHSSVLAWEIPWTEEPGGYSPWGCRESDTTESLSAHTGGLRGLSIWPQSQLWFMWAQSIGPKESDLTEWLSLPKTATVTSNSQHKQSLLPHPPPFPESRIIFWRHSVKCLGRIQAASHGNWFSERRPPRVAFRALKHAGCPHHPQLGRVKALHPHTRSPQAAELLLCTSSAMGKQGPTEEKSARSDCQALLAARKERKRRRNRAKQMELIQGTREPFTGCEKTSPHTI